MSKIAMYTTNEMFGKGSTGGSKRFNELYYGFIKMHLKVDLYCTDSQKVIDDTGIKAFSIEKVKPSKKVYIPTEVKSMFVNFSMIRRIKKQKYDSIIVFDVPTAIGLSILQVKNINLFIRQDLISYKRISLQDRTKSKFAVWAYLKMLKIAESISIRKAKRIIVQCDHDLQELLKRHKFISKSLKKKSIIQINNVNPSWITNNSKILPLYKQSILEKEYIVGFVGDFKDERKGHNLFLKTAARLSRNIPNIKFILVGDGQKLMNYIEQYKPYQNIEFQGRKSNPIPTIKTFSLMVVPSLEDSCPNTVLEALYNNIPVIGAKSGGIPEILINKSAIFDLNEDSLFKLITKCKDKSYRYDLLKKQNIRKELLTFDWTNRIYQIISR